MCLESCDAEENNSGICEFLFLMSLLNILLKDNLSDNPDTYLNAFAYV